VCWAGMGKKVGTEGSGRCRRNDPVRATSLSPQKMPMNDNIKSQKQNNQCFKLPKEELERKKCFCNQPLLMRVIGRKKNNT